MNAITPTEGQLRQAVAMAAGSTPVHRWLRAQAAAVEKRMEHLQNAAPRDVVASYEHRFYEGFAAALVSLAGALVQDVRQADLFSFCERSGDKKEDPGQ